MFGMVPHWADLKLARQTYNARTETVAAKPSFRHAFKQGQFCVIPVASVYEPNYETGKAIRWEIADADGAPLGDCRHLGAQAGWTERLAAAVLLYVDGQRRRSPVDAALSQAQR
jgi:hypothetical protein